MKISVVIPTYNRVHFIAEALTSVYAQTYPIHEIILVDDASDDETVSFVKKMYPDVVLIENERNGGVSYSRNKGIKKASGDFIAFLDVDDIWMPKKIEKQMEKAVEFQQAGFFSHTDEIWLLNGKRINQKKRHKKRGGNVYLDCLPLCMISPSTVVIEKTIFEKVGLFDTAMTVCEDYDLWLRITAHFSVSYVDESLVTKRGGHEDQLSKKHWGMDTYRIRALEKMLQCGAQTIGEAAYQATLLMFQEKVAIYLNGARKRNKQAEIVYYEAMAKRYA